MRRPTAIITSAAAMVMLVAPAPASAGLSYVESGNLSTAFGSQGGNGVDCPPSSFTVGGGVLSTGGYRQVAINSSFPESPSRWMEYIDVVSVNTGNQAHRAFAICDTIQPAMRTETKPVKSLRARTVRAACPSGKHVYGGGFYSNGGVGTTITLGSRPYDGPDADGIRDDGWEATFWNYSDSGPYFVTAYALCGSKKTTVRTKTVDLEKGSQGFLRKKCGSGERVTGGGAHIEVDQYVQWISAIYPDDADSDGINDDSWAAYFENTSSRKREITVYAICR